MSQVAHVLAPKELLWLLIAVLGFLSLSGMLIKTSMAMTIAFGLGFATILTMVVVPVLYATIFRIRIA